MAMMYRLDLEKTAEDIGETLRYVKSRDDVNPDKIGVTGFCLGGGLTFMTAVKFSSEIAAAAPFYGMVRDEWIEGVKDISVPIYLFFGGADPFIPRERVEEIRERFEELGKNYRLQIYEDADHGFFCNERSNYNEAAAKDAWEKLKTFLSQNLKK